MKQLFLMTSSCIGNFANQIQFNLNQIIQRKSSFNFKSGLKFLLKIWIEYNLFLSWRLQQCIDIKLFYDENEWTFFYRKESDKMNCKQFESSQTIPTILFYARSKKIAPYSTLQRQVWNLLILANPIDILLSMFIG